MKEKHSDTDANYEEKKKSEKNFDWGKFFIGFSMVAATVGAGFGGYCAYKGIKNSKNLMIDTMKNCPSISPCNIIDISPKLNTMDETIIHRAPHGVTSHVRNLPSGWKASDYKINEANSLGILLSEGQTLVDSYKTANKY